MELRKNTYFLLTKSQLVSCDLLTETPSKREIVITEGHLAGKKRVIHPDGVSWGKLYPRLFSLDERPKEIFVFKGRALAVKPNIGKKCPEIDNSYRFQPFLSNVIDSVNSKEPVLLTGGAGCGKTSHIEQLAARCNQPFLRVNLNAETRLSDFIGKLQVINGETVWIDGILPTAMKMGYWLLLDEVDCADPAILSLLHPVIEENPVLVLKENSGEAIRPHPDFRIFATANSIGAMQDLSSNYAGTNHMNEAFLDRWQVLFIADLPQKEEFRILRAKVGGLKKRWAKRIVEFAQKVREKKVDGVEFSSEVFSTRRVLSWARKTALLRCPIKGAKISWLDKLPAAEHELIERLLVLHFGGKRQKEKRQTEETKHYADAAVKRPRGRPRKQTV